MTDVPISTINTAIVTTMDALVASGDIKKTEDVDELSEGIQDCPMLQIYWESIDNDVSGETDRTTFRAVRRQQNIVFHIDVYAAQRAHIGQNMAAALDVVDAVIDILNDQDTAPYFGLVNNVIKAFSWHAHRQNFVYAGVRYVGARFILTFRVF